MPRYMTPEPSSSKANGKPQKTAAQPISFRAAPDNIERLTPELVLSYYVMQILRWFLPKRLLPWKILLQTLVMAVSSP